MCYTRCKAVQIRRSATITYYLAHREQVAAYLARVRQQQEDAWQEQQQHPSEFVRTLRERLDQQRQLYQAAQPRLAVAAER